jgi:hypothetical protein
VLSIASLGQDEEKGGGGLTRPMGQQLLANTELPISLKSPGSLWDAVKQPQQHFPFRKQHGSQLADPTAVRQAHART